MATGCRRKGLVVTPVGSTAKSCRADHTVVRCAAGAGKRCRRVVTRSARQSVYMNTGSAALPRMCDNVSSSGTAECAPLAVLIRQLRPSDFGRHVPKGALVVCTSGTGSRRCAVTDFGITPRIPGIAGQNSSGSDSVRTRGSAAARVSGMRITFNRWPRAGASAVLTTIKHCACGATDKRQHDKAAAPRL